MKRIRNQKVISALAKKVKELRKARKLSQYRLADEANITRSQIVDIENGESNPTISTLAAIAEALGVKPKDLLDF